MRGEEQLPDINWREYQVECSNEEIGKLLGVICLCLVDNQLNGCPWEDDDAT